MNGSNDNKQPGIRLSGLAWRLGLTAVLLGAGLVSTVRSASGAFEPASVPIANLAGQNAMVIGTARMMGDHFLLYNGTRIESLGDSMAVNFERGGTMTMCPRSQLQMLTADGGSGILLAFQSGGAQSLFPLRMGDEVMTPDWRVALTSDSRTGEMGLVQVVTNRHGDLCMQGEAQSGAYFRVTPTMGDGQFRVVNGQSARFSNGNMETSTQSCGCDASFEANGGSASPAAPASAAPVQVAAQGSGVGTASPIGAMAPAASAAPTASADAAMPAPAPAKAKVRKHPDDVAGYVSSFVHKLFGR